jgi:hypothetical protein
LATDSPRPSSSNCPDLAGAARLATLLRSRWAVSVNEEDDVALVDVYIRASRADLASLMRTVEDWVARESLRAIRFELDGRVYILESGEVELGRSAPSDGRGRSRLT